MDDNYSSSNREHVPSGFMPDEFDRLLGQLDGLNGVTHTKETTVTTIPPMGIGGSRTFIIQTYRQRDTHGLEPGESPRPSEDTIFVQCIGAGGMSFRHAFPAAVADAIARQRDALSTKSRKIAGRERAARDKAEGKVPGFMRGKRKKAKK